MVLISTDQKEDNRYHTLFCKDGDLIKKENKLYITKFTAEEKGYIQCPVCRA